MKQCKICKKKLPHHIFDGHMRKWHSEEVLESKKSPRPTLESKPESPRQEKTDIRVLEALATLTIEIAKLKDINFDYQKEETCASCGEIHPSILMRYHSHVKHGV